MTLKKNRAFLKWAGGKYSIVEQINNVLPEAELLVEPFVGAASVFLNTHFESYQLNDINPDLISLYNYLKDKPDQVISEAARLFTTHNNHENQYYELREDFNSLSLGLERAALFIYLNRHGYNGLCRYSSKGRFNVPFGRYKRPYFPEQEMLFFAEKAKKATFSCLPFERVFAQLQADSVVYCDPPYVPLSTSASFTSYAKHGFNFDDQQALATLARTTANDKKISVLLSNHDLPIIRELYDGASFKSFNVKRSISQNGKNRKPVKEILALFSSHC
ncbi:Dam family site-specific DNA-(adenine-N6)-methyltransferase [Alteromonas sediminis]|uniref:Site-specific DNA-methyltransferase (adenine-specific) n=1 Tax=Alteromonas sediminis TaxID=2259342 RepID=A0A3N5Z6W5_9ALTE|nr:Dam family site-specific DNA-(adenine-N6)-methyltransferase [Alteromonas sediminis]RPJ66374.1 Dam family site-specific DNA-(adenine-N6)-methyltransferase [Alteromonas sediminis]